METTATETVKEAIICFAIQSKSGKIFTGDRFAIARVACDEENEVFSNRGAMTSFGRYVTIPQWGNIARQQKSGLIDKTICPKKELIICPAIIAQNGEIFKGHSHKHAIQACERSGQSFSNNNQSKGFVTSTGRYVTCEEATEILQEIPLTKADNQGSILW